MSKCTTQTNKEVQRTLPITYGKWGGLWNLNEGYTEDPQQNGYLENLLTTNLLTT